MDRIPAYTYRPVPLLLLWLPGGWVGCLVVIITVHLRSIVREIPRWMAVVLFLFLLLSRRIASHRSFLYRQLKHSFAHPPVRVLMWYLLTRRWRGNPKRKRVEELHRFDWLERDFNIGAQKLCFSFVRFFTSAAAAGCQEAAASKTPSTYRQADRARRAEEIQNWGILLLKNKQKEHLLFTVSC